MTPLILVSGVDEEAIEEAMRDRPVPDVALALARAKAEAVVAAGEVPEIMVIGGAEVYALALPRAARVLLTRVHAHIEGDTRLPDFHPAHWRRVSGEEHAADDRHAFAMTFEELERA